MSAEAEAQPVSVLRVDFVREMTDGSGNRTVMERGHHFIADSGAWLMDKVSNGERISEIWLPASGERVVVNHDLRFAIRGPPGRGLADPGDPGVVGADRRVPSGFPGAAWIRGARFPVESGSSRRRRECRRSLDDDRRGLAFGEAGPGRAPRTSVAVGPSQAGYPITPFMGPSKEGTRILHSVKPSTNMSKDMCALKSSQPYERNGLTGI